MAKVAVSCQGKALDDLIDPRFGRAANFLIIDTDTMDFQVIDNASTRNLGQGAGVQSAETVASAGVEAVLTGHVGPKAFQGLNAARITIGQGLEGVTAREAVNRYKAGQVQVAEAPSKSGHWR